MRILVTGGSGMIGRALVDRFRAESQEVHSSSRRSVDDSNHHVTDLESPEEARSLVAHVSPTAIVHLAGGTTGNRHELYRANTLTTLNVLWAAAALPRSPQVVAVGSAAEYGDGAGENLDETALLRPVSEYGRAKVAATTLAEVVAERHGLPLTIARPFNVVSNLLPASTALGNFRRQLLEQQSHRRVVRCGRLDVVRDFVTLEFVVEALSRLTLGEVLGTYNICSGVGIALGSILDAMATRLGVEVEVEPLPELLAIAAADRIVGSPRRLAERGVSILPTAESLARACLDG